jgi:hypothetical protein
VTCTAAVLQGGRTDTTWLILSGVLFGMGAATAFIASVALRAFPMARLFDGKVRVFDPLRVVVGCIILIASGIAFFCGCATAILALLGT